MMGKIACVIKWAMYIWIYGLVGCMTINTMPLKTALLLIVLALTVAMLARFIQKG